MSRSRVEWHEWSVAPSSGSDLGHGIHFHDTHRSGRNNLVSFVEGFEWLRSRSAAVQGYHIKPNDVTTARVLASMKRRIERMVADQQVADGMISRRIRAIANA